MRIFFTLFGLLLFAQITIAEDFSDFEGTIAIKGGQVLSYKIVYKITKNNTIEGYSLTDFEGEKLTKSWIKGEYNPSKKTLWFKETGNAYTKTGDNESTFCFIITDNLKIKKYNGKTLIIGSFKGVYPSGKIGAVGNIFLVESKVLNEIKLTAKTKTKNTATNVPKKNPKSSDDDVADKDTTAIKQAMKKISENQQVVLMPNEKLSIECSKTDLCLDVWDGAYFDYDSISVYLNNKPFQENILLTKAIKTFKIIPPADKFNIKITALNLGQRGVNSVSFAVKDKNNIKQFLLKLNKGESFNIEFHIKK
jgi:hypothetical protein